MGKEIRKPKIYTRSLEVAFQKVYEQGVKDGRQQAFLEMKGKLDEIIAVLKGEKK
jgi:hypothetical protein